MGYHRIGFFANGMLQDPHKALSDGSCCGRGGARPVTWLRALAPFATFANAVSIRGGGGGGPDNLRLAGDRIGDTAMGSRYKVYPKLPRRRRCSRLLVL